MMAALGESRLQDQQIQLLPLWHPDGYGTLGQVRFLQRQDLPNVRALHDLAHKVIERPGLLAKETDAFFESHLNDVGRLIGIEQDGVLIAYCVLGLPTGADYNFGTYLDLPESELKCVAHCDGAVVHPTWRGARLHEWMILRRIELARESGRHHIFSTAAPLNPASWVHLVHEGFAIFKLMEMFGGDRYLLYLNLHHAHDIDRSMLSDVSVSDTLKQQSLLSDNWIGISSSRPPKGDRQEVKTFFAKRRI